MQVLIVEDDFISRRLLARYLEPYGECDVAINGKEAVKAVKHALKLKDQYDLICLDILMPGLSGQECLQEIRRLEQEHELDEDHSARIIMTTSLDDNGIIKKAFDASADGYVIKPIEKTRFLDTLQAIGLCVEEIQPA